MIDRAPKSFAFASGMEESDGSQTAAFEHQLVELFDELRGPLLRYLSHFPLSLHDAEDVIQEAFLSLNQHIRHGKSVQEARGWLFRASHNFALKKRLRLRKNLGSSPLAEDLATDPALNPEDLLLLKRKHERVQAVVRALPEQDRWCLYLRAEGLRYRQIADILNISLGSVSNCLQRSLARISQAVQR
jgi:RNA polymerase sigma-70 factor (ECF subfamily)